MSKLKIRILAVYARFSLKQKIIFALTTCSAGASLFLGLAVSTVAISAIEKGIQDRLEAINQAKAQELRSSFYSMTLGIKALAEANFVQEAIFGFEAAGSKSKINLNIDADIVNNEDFRTVRNGFVGLFEDFLRSSQLKSLAIALSNGSVVAHIGSTHLTGKNLSSGSAISSKVAECFKAANQSGVHFFSLHEDYDKTPRSYLCTQIKAKSGVAGLEEGALIGVLIAELNWDFFNKYSTFNFGLGETGEIILTTKDGVLKTTPRFQQVAETESLDRDIDLLGSAGASLDQKLVDIVSSKYKTPIDLGKKDLQLIKSYDGEEVFSIQNELKLDDMNEWIMITQLKSSEGRRPIVDMQRVSALLLLVCAFMASLFGYVFSNILAKKFTESGRRLSGANFSIVKVSDSFSEIASSINSGTQQQGSAIHETSTALEQMSSMVERTAEISNNSKTKSELCEKEAQTGLGKISELIEAVNKVDKSSQVTFQQVDKANSSFQDVLGLFNNIASKTQVINDIAFQTKLLSFNASVEAARAGVHGRGFAVVAEEVGKLAISVSGAAAEINTLLSSSTAKIDNLIIETKRGLEKAMSESKGEIASSKSIASECNRFFESLSSLVGEMNTELSQISTAAGEQKTGIQEINKAVAQIAVSNEENEKNVSAIFDLSQDLQQVVGELTHANKDIVTLVSGTQSPSSPEAASVIGISSHRQVTDKERIAS